MKKTAQRRDFKNCAVICKLRQKNKKSDEETTSKFPNNTALVCELGEVDSANILVADQCFIQVCEFLSSFHGHVS